MQYASKRDSLVYYQVNLHFVVRHSIMKREIFYRECTWQNHTKYIFLTEKFELFQRGRGFLIRRKIIFGYSLIHPSIFRSNRNNLMIVKQKR